MTWVVVAALAAAVAGWGLVRPPALRRLWASPPDAESRAGTRRAAVLDVLFRWVPALDPGRRRAARLAAEVAGVCDLLAVCIEAGRPPRGALRVVADVMDEPTRGVLLGVLQQIDLGVDEARAWTSLGRTPGYAGVARDVARSVHSGVALADLLRHHARDARRRAAARAEATARTAGVQSVIPLVVCFLPAFFLLGIVPIFGGLFG